MALDSSKIRHEIRRILTENGRTRGKELADEVVETVGSEKTVYREIKAMYDEGELERTEYNRAKVEYELNDVTKIIEGKLQFLYNQAKNIYENLEKFHEDTYNKKTIPSYGQRLFTLVFCIKQTQNIQTTLRILEASPVFRKSKSFYYLQKHVAKMWASIIGNISHQPEEKFIEDVFMNFRTTTLEHAQPLEKHEINSL